MAWPTRALDVSHICGICSHDVLISAYDASRVEAWVDSTKLGTCHLVCVTKLVGRNPDDWEAEVGGTEKIIKA